MERKEFSIARFLSSKSRFDNIVLLGRLYCWYISRGCGSYL